MIAIIDIFAILVRDHSAGLAIIGNLAWGSGLASVASPIMPWGGSQPFATAGRTSLGGDQAKLGPIYSFAINT